MKQREGLIAVVIVIVVVVLLILASVRYCIRRLS